MQEVSHILAQGFANLPVAAHYKQTALRVITQWLADDTFSAYRPQLQWLIEQQQWSLLLDSFYRTLPFGTGGRRGPVGLAPTGSTRGRWRHRYKDILPICKNATHSRNSLSSSPMMCGSFTTSVASITLLFPIPSCGLTSRDFAWVAAGVYTANGVRVHMLPEDTTTYISTPELSFTIRYLHATAGLNISASHNHPDDNGGKFYNDRGGQEIPPHDEVMARKVEHVERVRRLDVASAKASGLISWISPHIHDAYVALNVAQTLQPTARQALCSVHAAAWDCRYYCRGRVTASRV